MAVCRQPARRFRQREAQYEDDQGADADDDPDAAPTDPVAQRERQQDADRPWPRSTDELHQSDDTAADALRCVFGGVGKAQRLLGAEADAGEEAEDQQPGEAGLEPDARD